MTYVYVKHVYVIKSLLSTRLVGVGERRGEKRRLFLYLMKSHP